MKHIRLYDFAGHEITQFAQWDKNVYVTIEGAALEEAPVVYFHANGIHSYKSNGTVLENGIACIVPPEVLTQTNPITVTLGYFRGVDEFVTPYYTVVPVMRRPKLSEEGFHAPEYIEGDDLSYGGN